MKLKNKANREMTEKYKAMEMADFYWESFKIEGQTLSEILKTKPKLEVSDPPTCGETYTVDGYNRKKKQQSDA